MPGRQRDLPGFVRVKEAAHALGVSDKTMWVWIEEGRVPVVRLGSRTVRIPQQWLEDLAATTAAS
jgi:excisionase family DNA binding protein